MSCNTKNKAEFIKSSITNSIIILYASNEFLCMYKLFYLQ